MVEKPLTPGQRVYAIGDVHGQFHKLTQMHALIRQDLRDRPAPQPLLVHLGDLIDRGPDSAGCVGLLAAGPPLPGVPAVTLMGNHEAMLLAALDAVRPERALHWLQNGGTAALRSWGVPDDAPFEHWRVLIPAAHLGFIRGLPLHHRLGRYLFVHAGVQPGVALAQQDEEELMWIREGFLNWSGPMLPDAPDTIVVHGHTPRPEPVVRPNRIGVDTGAGHGHALSCAVLEGDGVHFLQT